jgi:CheY-like chemotaxis protein
LNILLVEDNVVNQRVALRLLQKFGHNVTVAANGREALSTLANQERPFDVVFMDVQMPEMDGLETTREIRRREKPTGDHLPIIALTAHAMKTDEESCFEAGMDKYLTKPVQADLVLEALRDISTLKACRQ